MKFSEPILTPIENQHNYSMTRKEFSQLHSGYEFIQIARLVLKKTFAESWMLKYYMTHDPCTKSAETICYQLDIDLKRTYPRTKKAIQEFLIEEERPGKTTIVKVNYNLLAEKFTEFLSQPPRKNVGGQQKTPPQECRGLEAQPPRKNVLTPPQECTPITNIIKNITTTTEPKSMDAQADALISSSSSFLLEWGQIKIPTTLLKLGFTLKTLEKAIKADISTNDLQLSLNAFAFDLKANNKIDSVISPLGYFINSVNVNGKYNPPSNFGDTIYEMEEDKRKDVARENAYKFGVKIINEEENYQQYYKPKNVHEAKFRIAN